MARRLLGHAKIMFCLDPGLVKALKHAATEKRQTYSAVAEEWLERGRTEYEARKGASAAPIRRETDRD
ncbi:MAG: hypothetical protein WBP56_09335 [Polyangia bacterium]|jgi:hypothetical protein